MDYMYLSTYICRQQDGTPISDSSTEGSGDPALCELQVPLARRIASNVSALSQGDVDGRTGLISPDRKIVWGTNPWIKILVLQDMVSARGW
jgi:hypothetical protein